MGRKKKIQEVEAAEVVDLAQDNSFVYVVQPGDGIKKIARKLQKDYKQIVEDNDLKEPYELYISQKLIIK